MTNLYDDPLNRAGALPGPEAAPGLYDGVALRRLFAWIIDVLAVWGLAFLVSILMLGLGFLFFAPLAALIDFFYRVLSISGGSATFGMRMTGIELRDSGGRRLNFGTALIHTLLFYVMFIFGLLQLISVVLMAASRPGRGLHDMLLGVTMINRPF